MSIIEVYTFKVIYYFYIALLFILYNMITIMLVDSERVTP